MTTSDSGDQTPPFDGSSADGPYGPPPAQNPYGQTPPPPPPAAPAPATPSPYGPPQTPPPGQPAYAAPAYGAPQQPGYGYTNPAPANHPSATTALVLGLVGLGGLLFCGGLTLVLSPFAWQTGARAVREIDAQPGMYGGRDQANAGKIMGIIGTALLALGVIALLGLVLLVAVSRGSSSP